MQNETAFDPIPLIKRVQSGDSTAFSELVEQYKPMMNKVISGFVGSLISFDEAYSEACVILHRAATSYDVSRSDVTFGLYGHICIYRRLCDVAAKASRDTSPVDTEVDVDTLYRENNLEARMVSRERVKEYMERARAVLSDYEYRVFLMYIDGYTTAECAAELGKDAKSIDNAKARMFKSLRKKSREFSDI